MSMTKHKSNVCSECAHEKGWIDGDCCPFWQLDMCNGTDNRKYFKKKIDEEGVNEGRYKKMHIPKYIKNALEQRAKHAERFNHYDYIVSEWIDKYNIIAEECDYHGGVESIVNPFSSSERLLEAIKNTKRN